MMPLTTQGGSGQDTTAGTTILGTRVPLQRYYDAATSQYVPAVHHADYRHVWLHTLPSTRYAHKRIAGFSPDDKTCYYDRHHTWGADRRDWPDALFRYMPDIAQRGKVKVGPVYTQEGWLVVDLKSKPLLNFRMPMTLSSKAEPWLLEALMRENYGSNIKLWDLRARMPGTPVKDEIKVSNLSMALTRFRLQAGCLSWTGNLGSEAIKTYMDALLPTECKEANSTRGFRNLHAHERLELENVNFGLYPKKARAAARNAPNAAHNTQVRWDNIVKKHKHLRRAFDEEEGFTDAWQAVQDKRRECARRNSDVGLDVNEDNEINGGNDEIYNDEALRTGDRIDEALHGMMSDGVNGEGSIVLGDIYYSPNSSLPSNMPLMPYTPLGSDGPWWEEEMEF